MPRRATVLDSTQYSALLNDVRKLLLDTKSRPANAKLSAYWTIGQRISHERLSSNAGYLNGLLIREKQAVAFQ